MIRNFYICIILFTSTYLFAQPHSEVPDDFYMSSSIWHLKQLKENSDSLFYTYFNATKYHCKGDSVLIEVNNRNPIKKVSLELFKKLGGNLDHSYKNYAAGYFQIDDLLSLPYQTLTEYFIFLPPHDLNQGDFEGPIVTNSQTYETGTSTNPDAGEGINIAIFDSGYNDYDTLTTLNPPEVSTNYTYYDCSSGSCIQATLPSATGNNDHGTSCAEIVYDHAPAANYRIYNTPSFMNSITASAINHAASWADIITMSQSKYNFGWDDDDGLICDAITNLGDSVLFFYSAGNRNGTHYQGSFIDIDTNERHDFADNSNVLLFNLRGNESGEIFLQWDGNDDDAYDFYVQDNNPGSGAMIGSRVVGGTNISGFENISISPCAGCSNTVAQIIIERNGPSTPDFELWKHFGAFRPFINDSSDFNQTSSPGNCTHPNLLGVAAVDEEVYNQTDSNNLVEFYSSRGPTNNGSVSVELTGPANVFSRAELIPGGGSDSTFGGTSSATPNAAGVAAALWSKLPDATASDIRRLLIDFASNYRDFIPEGNDNIYGAGGVYLPTYDINIRYVDQNAGLEGVIPEGLVYPWYSVKDVMELSDDDKTIILLTDDETAPVVIDKNFIIKTLDNYTGRLITK